MILKKYAPKLPLESNGKDNFVLIDNSLTNAKQLLRMIVLTNPGEKILDPEFGIGIRKYLFEQGTNLVKTQLNASGELETYVEDMRQEILGKLIEQTTKYSPDIYVSGLQLEIVENTANMSVYYSYKGYPEGLVAFTITF